MSVICIHDAITALLNEQTELPHFHFNEALFKPFEILLCLELCDSDIQDQVNPCGFFRALPMLSTRGAYINQPSTMLQPDAFRSSVASVNSLKAIVSTFGLVGDRYSEVFV